MLDRIPLPSIKENLASAVTRQYGVRITWSEPIDAQARVEVYSFANLTDALNFQTLYESELYEDRVIAVELLEREAIEIYSEWNTFKGI